MTSYWDEPDPDVGRDQRHQDRQQTRLENGYYEDPQHDEPEDDDE